MNSRIAVFSLLAMVAVASTLPGFNKLTGNYMTPVFTPATSLRSAVSNDELQMCGTYDTGCMASEIMSMSSGLVLQGALDQDPTLMQMDLHTYIGGNCTEEAALVIFRCHYNLQVVPSNDIDRTFNMTATAAEVKITALSMVSMNCTTPVEIGQWYDIMQLNCTDAQGQDPYANMKESMGASAIGNFNRNATCINIVEDGSALPYLFISTEGCSGTSGPTQPPTPAPSTQPPTPAPSTQPPTPAPSTQPPTPAPSTQPPTPAPSTQPPTPGPTSEPTQPPTPGPTAEPTATPTKAPINWMMIAIIGGGALALIILLLLICCCCRKCKSGKNTNSRVRRVGKQNIESQPLKKNYI